MSESKRIQRRTKKDINNVRARKERDYVTHPSNVSSEPVGCVGTQITDPSTNVTLQVCKFDYLLDLVYMCFLEFAESVQGYEFCECLLLYMQSNRIE